MTLKRPPDGGRPGRPEGSSSAMETNPTGGTAVSSSDRLQKKKEAEDLVQKREPHARVSHTHFCILYICIYIRGTFVAMKCGHLTFPL